MGNLSKYLRGTAVSKKSPEIVFIFSFPSKGKFSINNLIQGTLLASMPLIAS